MRTVFTAMMHYRHGDVSFPWLRPLAFPDKMVKRIEHESDPSAS